MKTQTSARLAPLLLAALFSGLVLLWCDREALAGDWIFRRSYFSHAAAEPGGATFAPHLPESRSAYRRPWVGTSPGFSARGGYRYNNIFLRSGNSVDWTVIREDWFEINP